MKKTIAATILMVSASSSIAIMGPNHHKLTTMCLKVSSLQDKSKVVEDCDESDNNKEQKRKLNANGCAAGQVSLQTYDQLNIPGCMPVGMVQL